MKIDFNRSGDLAARMTITISPQDYAPLMADNVKNYSKKLAIKGFRSGKTPKSVLTKMYGRGILEETVMKLLNDKLFAYLEENKIQYFGSPLMPEDAEPVDFNPKVPEEYTFVFDLGLKPTFELNYQSDQPVEVSVPSVDKNAIEEDIIRYRRIFGDDETITEGRVEKYDKVTVGLQKIGEDGKPVDGEPLETVVDLDRIKGDANELLPGKSIGDKLDVELVSFLGQHRDYVIKSVLHLDGEAGDEEQLNYQLTIKTINRPQAAELSGEQLTTFVGRAMESENDFRQMLEERENNQNLGRALDMKKMMVRSRLVDANTLELPEAFLLDWVNRQREKKIEADSRDARRLFRDTRWSLLLNRIAEEKGLEVTEKDVQKQVTNWVVENVNYQQVDIRKMMERLYADEYFMSSMKENALEEVVFQAVLQAYTFSEKEVSVDEFGKIYHDIHHVMFEHEHHDHDDHHPHDHGDHDHGHSHESHEHSHG